MKIYFIKKVWKGGFQLMLILGLLGMYFDAVVVFVTNSSRLFRLFFDDLRKQIGKIIYHYLKNWDFQKKKIKKWMFLYIKFFFQIFFRNLEKKNLYIKTYKIFTFWKNFFLNLNFWNKDILFYLFFWSRSSNNMPVQ